METIESQEGNSNFSSGESPNASLEDRIKLIESVAAKDECLTPEELRGLLIGKQKPIAYDGFEPSGRIHIAQGLVKALLVNKMIKAGCHFIFWIADWFALLNGKMDSDMKKIRLAGDYMIEIWKACGMDMSKVTFLWASEEINRRPDEYWSRVIDIASKNSLARITKCVTIMGKKETDKLSASQILYPCMQCADIFFLKADICQLGLDQRKVNTLAREYAQQIGRKCKPIVVSHRMLSGLKKGQVKSSKSDPSSAIFMDDTEAEVNEKIKNAWCPERELEGNPIIDYVENVISLAREEFLVKRKHSPEKLFKSAEEVKKEFVTGDLHPDDLKKAVAQTLNQLLQPIRNHFEKTPSAKALGEQVRKIVREVQKKKEREKAKKVSISEAFLPEAETDPQRAHLKDKGILTDSTNLNWQIAFWMLAGLCVWLVLIIFALAAKLFGIF